MSEALVIIGLVSLAGFALWLADQSHRAHKGRPSRWTRRRGGYVSRERLHDLSEPYERRARLEEKRVKRGTYAP